MSSGAKERLSPSPTTMSLTLDTTTSATPQDSPAAVAVDAQNLLDLGIRSLSLKKYEDACESLSRAVEALVDKYGEMAPEVGDAMLLYGKALLANAIAQSAVLGAAPEEAEEKLALLPGTSTSAPVPLTASSIRFSFGGDEPDDEATNDDDDGEDEGEGEGEGDAAAGGDREDDLETAFLMLDTARAIFAKVDSREAKEKVAEAHRLLGDVGVESETFESAVSEYSSSLHLLTSFLPPHHRSLSELHMLIALALENVPNKVDQTVFHAEESKKVLQLKLESLKNLPEERTEKVTREIKDLGELLVDVENKIEDLKIVPEAAPKTATELALEELIRGATGPNQTKGIINNLNSLVRKKKVVPAVVDAQGVEMNGNGNGSGSGSGEEGLKRKAEQGLVGEGGGAGEGSGEKKARVE